MKNPKETINWKGSRFTIEWMKTNSLKTFAPITQVYGVCFNDKGEILIEKRSSSENWIIPGGHPEEGETIEETLKREMIEEADTKIKNIWVLGVQKVFSEDNPDDHFYQVRCVCELDELLPQTPDPDNGEDWERKFVPAEKVAKYVKWGATGEAMFKDAIELFKNSK